MTLGTHPTVQAAAVHIALLSNSRSSAMASLNPLPAASSKLKAPGPASAPSPTPSNSSTGGGGGAAATKRKPPPSVPFSQPAETGTGNFIITQVYYAQEYLKDKDRAMSFDDIWHYLSLGGASPQTMALFKSLLQSGRVQIVYDPDGLNGQGSYRYRSPHNVRSADQLKGYLQRQATMQGVLVKELKDGWTGAAPAVDALEASGDILVTRGKKNQDARVVWADDPSLRLDVRPDFRAMWHQVHLPANPDDLRTKLLQAGLKPTTEKRVVSTMIKPKDKKRKGPRKGGKQTNTHMAGLLKDYSHLRK
ncbi:MAG: hypothetical protein INR71_08270 [Terriglobus roseus]|nr:hypothetical protein [Terriglobus roseus]